MQAVVLAAGKGKRLQPLTHHKPKGMALLSGKPLLWFVLDSLKKSGVTESIIVTGYLGEQIQSYFGRQFKKMKLEYAEQKQQLGTAHALLQAKQKVKGDFLMIHGDVIVSPKDLKALMQLKGFPAIMVLRKEKQPEKFGVVVTEDKLVAEIMEKPQAPKTDLVNAACYKFSPEIFESLEKTKINPERKEFELTDTLKSLLKEKKVGFHLATEKIFDIGTIEELRDAKKEIG
ncbi:nucleotidyltransferase family protein [Candidatus Micrarchaeota archaeon]|nr:nucleotidyltransferase family protein [Candidatus Micrarchaeota archaeon]